MLELRLDSPFLENLGIQVVSWDKDHIELVMPVDDYKRNRQGVVQGGAIVTLLDAAAGYAGLYNNGALPDRRSATLSLTTNFVYKGDGGELRATGILQRVGRSVYFSRAEVWNTDDVMVATAVGVYKYATLSANSNELTV